MIFVNDSFTDTDGVDLSAHTGETGATWTIHTSMSTGNIIHAANRIRNSNDNNDAVYYASGIPADADYDVEGIFYNASEAQFTGVCGRVSTAARTYYECRLRSFTGWQLLKYVGGTLTTVGTSATDMPGTGATKTAMIYMRGSDIRVKSSGVDRVTTTDSDITAAGRAGVYFKSSASWTDTYGYHLQSLVATDTSAGGGVTEPMLERGNRGMHRGMMRGAA